MRPLYFLLLSGLLFGTMAQSQNIDSLRRCLSTMPADTNKVLTYRLLYRALYSSDQTSEMLPIAIQGLDLSRQLQYEKGIDLFIFYKASILDILGRGAEAIPLFEEGLQMSIARGDLSAAADYHINLGTAFQAMGSLDRALFHFLAAYHQYEADKNLENTSKILNNIGVVYRKQQKLDRAESIYKQSLDIKKTLQDSLGIAATYQNLAHLLSLSNNNRQQEAVAYIQSAIALYRRLDKKEDVAGCESLWGQLYLKNNQITEAKHLLLASYRYFKQYPSVEYSADNCKALATIAAKEGRSAEAEQYLAEGLKLAQTTGHSGEIFTILLDLSVAQHALGKNEQAYLSIREAMALHDTIFEEKRVSIIEEMQAKFDITQKDSELKINQLELDQRTRQRNWSLIAIALLAGLAIFVFSMLRQRMRTKQKIAEQAATLQQQTILQLEQAQQLTALNSMILGQEKERTRIAQDLHDGLGGLLSSVKSHFNMLPYPTQSAQLHTKTNALIDNACEEVRQIAHDMMPRTLALTGLSGALEDLAADLQKRGFHCELEMDTSDLSPDMSVSLYRIIQEISNNVVKHAQADHLLIQLLHRDGQVMLLVEDNGIGFDLESARQKKGLGLSGIEARVQYLGGTIEWDSVQGSGTTVLIHIPAPETA